jgi:hypothetical protein
VALGTRGSMLSLGNALRGALCAVLRGRAPASLPWRERVLEALKALGAEGAAEASLKYIQRQEYKEAKWVEVTRRRVVVAGWWGAGVFTSDLGLMLMLQDVRGGQGCCSGGCSGGNQVMASMHSSRVVTFCQHQLHVSNVGCQHARAGLQVSATACSTYTVTASELPHLCLAAVACLLKPAALSERTGKLSCCRLVLFPSCCLPGGVCLLNWQHLQGANGPAL